MSYRGTYWSLGAAGASGAEVAASSCLRRAAALAGLSLEFWG